MTWHKTPEDRARDRQVYGPEWRRQRAAALRRANGRCEKCGRRDRPLQVDHRIPVSQGGTHHLDNLQVLCSGPGSCHAAKSAGEGGDHGRGRSHDPAPRQDAQWW